MQNKDYWYPWFPVKFRRKTIHLTREQRHAYRDLIDWYMETGEPLPNSDVALSSITGLDLDSWRMAAAMLLPFFAIGEDGLLHHKMCDLVLQEQLDRTHSRSERGKKGAEKRWKKQGRYSSSHSSAISCSVLNDATTQHNTVLEDRDIESLSSAKPQKIDNDKPDASSGSPDASGCVDDDVPATTLPEGIKTRHGRSGAILGSSEKEDAEHGKNRGCQLPGSWKPNDQHRAMCESLALDVETLVGEFTDHHRARGTVFKDWDAGFRTWIRNAAKYRSGKGRPADPRPTYCDSIRDAGRAALDNIERQEQIRKEMGR